MYSDGKHNIFEEEPIISFTSISTSSSTLGGGASVSNFEKKSVGASLAGACVKNTLGLLEGFGVGTSVGVIEGLGVGDIVGFNVGFTEGGGKKGLVVPNMRSFQTASVGLSVGAKVVGFSVGATV